MERTQPGMEMPLPIQPEVVAEPEAAPSRPAAPKPARKRTPRKSAKAAKGRAKAKGRTSKAKAGGKGKPRRKAAKKTTAKRKAGAGKRRTGRATQQVAGTDQVEHRGAEHQQRDRVGHPAHQQPRVVEFVVGVAAPVRKDLDVKLAYTADVLPNRQVAIFSKVSGYIRKLGAERGDFVREGAVLAEIEAQELSAAVEQARAAVATAEANLKVAESNVESARANAVNHEANLARARAVADNDARNAFRLDDLHRRPTSPRHPHPPIRNHTRPHLGHPELHRRPRRTGLRDEAQLPGFRVLQDGEVAPTVDVRRPVGIELTFRVLRGEVPLFPKIKVLDQHGEVAFNAIDTGSRWDDPPEPGEYVSTAWIPGNLLNEGPPPPIQIGAAKLDLSERFFRTATVDASPAAGSETVVATLNVTPELAVMEGVIVWAYVALTIGASGVSLNTRIRRDSVSGTIIKASGATTVTAANLVDRAIVGTDTSPSLPNEVYVLTLTVGSGAAESTVSAVELACLVI